MEIEDSDLQAHSECFRKVTTKWTRSMQIQFFPKKKECDYLLKFSQTHWVNLNVDSDFDSNLARTFLQQYRDIDTEIKRESRAECRRNNMDTLPFGSRTELVLAQDAKVENEIALALMAYWKTKEEN